MRLRWTPAGQGREGTVSDRGGYAVAPVNVPGGRVAWQVSRDGVSASALLFKSERQGQRLAEWDHAVLRQARERAR